MRKVWMLALLVACFGLAVPGCSDKKAEESTAEDMQKKAGDTANDAMKKANDAAPK